LGGNTCRPPSTTSQLTDERQTIELTGDPVANFMKGFASEARKGDGVGGSATSKVKEVLNHFLEMNDLDEGIN